MYCPQSYVVRTCGLYGHKGSRGKGGNFGETMLRLGASGKPVRVVSDQICTPTSTAALAVALARLVETDAFGLYHGTCEGACSWHDLAAETFRLSNLTVDLTAIPTSQYPTPARRPPYSVLDGARLRSLGIHLPDWREALRVYLGGRNL
jgi:dTDP-4-dehydrorhamnose reductase